MTNASTDPKLKGKIVKSQRGNAANHAPKHFEFATQRWELGRKLGRKLGRRLSTETTAMGLVHIEVLPKTAQRGETRKTKPYRLDPSLTPFIANSELGKVINKTPAALGNVVGFKDCDFYYLYLFI